MKGITRSATVAAIAVLLTSISLVGSIAGAATSDGSAQAATPGSGDATYRIPPDQLSELFQHYSVSKISPPGPAPDFTLDDLSGSPQTLSDLKGDFVFLNFWNSECPPCRDEMPDMDTLWNATKNHRFTMLAVNVREPRAKVKKWIEHKDRNYTFPVLLDITGKVARMYGIQYFPTTYFINPQGDVVGGLVGPRAWNTTELVQFIRSLPDRSGETG